MLEIGERMEAKGVDTLDTEDRYGDILLRTSYGNVTKESNTNRTGLTMTPTVLSSYGDTDLGGPPTGKEQQGATATLDQRPGLKIHRRAYSRISRTPNLSII